VSVWLTSRKKNKHLRTGHLINRKQEEEEDKERIKREKQDEVESLPLQRKKGMKCSIDFLLLERLPFMKKEKKIKLLVGFIQV